MVQAADEANLRILEKAGEPQGRACFSFRVLQLLPQTRIAQWSYASHGRWDCITCLELTGSSRVSNTTWDHYQKLEAARNSRLFEDVIGRSPGTGARFLRSM